MATIVSLLEMAKEPTELVYTFLFACLNVSWAVVRETCNISKAGVEPQGPELGY